LNPKDGRIEEIEKAFRDILTAIGEDPEREGLLKTPRRAAEAMLFMTKGYREDPSRMIRESLFEERYDDMIIIKDIEFYSLCEHHILPFFGRCHVGYIPAGKIVGISKIARLVDIFSRRLQMQERLTNQIAHTLWKDLKPLGVGVVIEAQHLCMMIRGVQKQNSKVVTSAVLGSFRKDRATRAEFMDLLKVSNG